MEMAIEKAKKYGISMVSARSSNHYGICAYYTKMAMDKGLIGFSCTNTSPLMAPTNSSKAALGTNPFSFGMATCDDEFLLDMATTAVALGKIELAIRKNEEIPKNWALGTDGKMTRDPNEAYKANMLMPLGATENYKGYGLALMVEVLCGILSGSQFGPNIRLWRESDKIADLGQCFMAINPEAFGCGSKERLEILLRQLRCLPSAINKPIMVHGDFERNQMEKVDREGGITYHPNQLEASKKLAKCLKVEPLKTISKS